LHNGYLILVDFIPQSLAPCVSVTHCATGLPIFVLGKVRSIHIRKAVQNTSGALYCGATDLKRTTSVLSKIRNKSFRKDQGLLSFTHCIYRYPTIRIQISLQSISVYCIQLPTDVPLFHAVSVYLIINTRLKMPTKFIDVFKIPCTRFSHKNFTISYEIKRWK
jgi:type III secretory pathway component EscV